MGDSAGDDVIFIAIRAPMINEVRNALVDVEISRYLRYHESDNDSHQLEAVRTLDATIEARTGHELNVAELIQSRRSISKMTTETPPRAVIEQVLEAATWAPNHHVTEPWRFVVVAGDARIELGAVMAQSKIDRRLAEGRISPPGEFEALRRKALRSPVIIAVASDPDDRGPHDDYEDQLATAAAIQNMLLTAHSLGLAAIWRSGDALFDPNVRAHLGFPERATMIGFVYLGYPAMQTERSRRTPAAEFTTWRGWHGD